MPICILRGVFVDCVARAICASGLTHIWDKGVHFAEQLCEVMGFDHDPAGEQESHMCPATAASDDYVSEILRGIKEEEHEWDELD